MHSKEKFLYGIPIGGIALVMGSVVLNIWMNVVTLDKEVHGLTVKKSYLLKNFEREWKILKELQSQVSDLEKQIALIRQGILRDEK